MLNDISINANMLITLYILFGGELCILSAVAQLVFSKGRIENLLLFVFYLFLGILLIQFIFILNFKGIEIKYPGIFFFHLSLIFISGPLFYLYCLMLIKPDFKVHLKHLYYFIPGFAMIIMDIAVQFLPDHQRNILLNSILRGSLKDSWSIFAAIRAVAFTQCIFHHSNIVRNIIKFWKPSEMNFVIRVSIVINVVVILPHLTLFLYAIFGWMFLFKSGLIMITTINILMFFMGFRYPEFLYLLKQEIKKQKYERSSIKGLDTDNIKTKLIELMEVDNLFCDENITIKKIADEVSITSHQLSEYLNNNLNMNFKTFINTYRIEDAKRLLIEEPDQTVLSIAFAVGFSSQSTFYSVFSKYVGTTPQKYRKSNAL